MRLLFVVITGAALAMAAFAECAGGSCGSFKPLTTHCPGGMCDATNAMSGGLASNLCAGLKRRLLPMLTCRNPLTNFGGRQMNRQSRN
jgi:hypothetical protein